MLPIIKTYVWAIFFANLQYTHSFTGFPNGKYSQTRTQAQSIVVTSKVHSLRINRKKPAFRFQSSSVVLYSEDDSEWYVEPPPKVSAVIKLPKGAVPNVRDIDSSAELREFLSQDDRLCIVRFHATWCKSCQKFGLHFDKLASQKADWVDAKAGNLVKRNDVRIASIEWSKNEALCKELGVTKLPTVQFFSSGRRVGQVAVAASKFSKVQEAVDRFLTLSSKELEFSANVEQGAALIQSNVLDIDTVQPNAVDSTSDRSRPNGKIPDLEKVTATSDTSDPVVSTSAAIPSKTISRRTPLRRKWWIRNEN